LAIGLEVIENIGWLNVAVNDAFACEVIHSLHHLPEKRRTEKSTITPEDVSIMD
jgi:hypothetical protein